MLHTQFISDEKQMLFLESTCLCVWVCMCACVYVYVYVYVRSLRLTASCLGTKHRKHQGLLRINKHGLSKQDFALNITFISQPCLESRLNKNSLKNNL